MWICTDDCCTDNDEEKEEEEEERSFRAVFLNMLYKVTEELLRVAVSALIALFHTVKWVKFNVNAFNK